MEGELLTIFEKSASKLDYNIRIVILIKRPYTDTRICSFCFEPWGNRPRYVTYNQSKFVGLQIVLSGQLRYDWVH